MKYIAYIEETNHGHVKIEAESEHQALDKAYMDYENGDVFWDGTDTQVTKIEKIENQSPFTAKHHAQNIIDMFEELLDYHNIYIPDEFREGEEGEACIFGATYGNLEVEIADYITKMILPQEG